ncbi:hypothetical protein FE257_003325 [Aspergillus nanangensis]|uniref:Uncharacterized protein n=1 Tax=Aspergillus nanangensis TaxID=2582783 RepID=A0AAD4CSE5_ASPNN|nr:hypothetical protein FE257_003325 [Aspergillus nanangensis]
MSFPSPDADQLNIHNIGQEILRALGDTPARLAQFEQAMAEVDGQSQGAPALFLLSSTANLLKNYAKPILVDIVAERHLGVKDVIPDSHPLANHGESITSIDLALIQDDLSVFRILMALGLCPDDWHLGRLLTSAIHHSANSILQYALSLPTSKLFFKADSLALEVGPLCDKALEQGRVDLFPLLLKHNNDKVPSTTMNRLCEHFPLSTIMVVAQVGGCIWFDPLSPWVRETTLHAAVSNPDPEVMSYILQQAKNSLSQEWFQALLNSRRVDGRDTAFDLAVIANKRDHAAILKHHQMLLLSEMR